MGEWFGCVETPGDTFGGLALDQIRSHLNRKVSCSSVVLQTLANATFYEVWVACSPSISPWAHGPSDIVPTHIPLYRDDITGANRCAAGALNGFRCSRHISAPLPVFAAHARYFIDHLRLPPWGEALLPHRGNLILRKGAALTLLCLKFPGPRPDRATL